MTAAATIDAARAEGPASGGAPPAPRRPAGPLRCLLVLLALLSIHSVHAREAARPERAASLAISSEGDVVVVRLALARPFEGPVRAVALTEPLRLAFDIAGAATARTEAAGAGPVQAARMAQFDPATVRLVLDLASPLALVSATRSGPSALELRLQPTSAGSYAAAVRRGRVAVALAAPAGPQPRELAEIERLLAEEDRQLAAASAARRARGRRPLVVIDAGHGGKDTGAVSVHGRLEKDFTLAVALAARRAIEQRGGIDIRLTRADDRFLSLAERVRIAREAGADLFISIHADSAPNALARGASVYTLSELASDREAARLARRENRADLIAGVDLSDQDSEVVPILVDLGRRESMNQSAGFAQLLQQRLAARGIAFRSEFHRFAGFHVLRNLGVPAVLLESGYLSNEEDSRALFERETQERIAEGIADAVRAWLLP